MYTGTSLVRSRAGVSVSVSVQSSDRPRVNEGLHWWSLEVDGELHQWKRLFVGV